MRSAVALFVLCVLLAGCAGPDTAAPPRAVGDSSCGSHEDSAAAETSRDPEATPPESQTTSRTTASSETKAAAKTTETTPEPDANTELRTVTISASNGEKVRVRVEIADTFAGRAIGLMYRKTLPERRGMLFVYTDEETRTYTMANTYIPLSIAFMDSEGCIVDIQNMKPLDDDPPGYTSADPAQYALEVNRGFFEDRGVEVGDRAKLPE